VDEVDPALPDQGPEADRPGRPATQARDADAVPAELAGEGVLGREHVGGLVPEAGPVQVRSGAHQELLRAAASEALDQHQHALHAAAFSAWYSSR
jgi:hypothetical protein